MADISTVLRDLSQAGTQVKQGRLLPAVNAARAGAAALMSGRLLRAEQEDCARMLADACAHIGNNAEVRRLFPLSLAHRPGEEGALRETLTELLRILEENAASGAEALLREYEARQQVMLDNGRKELDRGDIPAARALFGAMRTDFPDDAGLHVDIAETYLQHNLADDAAAHLEAAHAAPRASAHVYNRLGIALRKIKRYDTAEINFKKALALEPSDPNLHFNLGRVYLDCGHWEEARKAGEAAVSLDPAFEEARKLAAYAAKKLGA